MIEELRALFAELYAAGCEHDNYAYALSDELNAEIDKALLKAFKNDLENLALRCDFSNKTEKYALNHMRGHLPARHFVWKKLRRVPNAAAKAISDVLEKGETLFAEGSAAQTARIEWAIRMAQGGVAEEPDGDLPEEEAAEAAEVPQSVPQGGEEAATKESEEEGEKPQERRKTSRRGEKKPKKREKPKEKAEAAGKPESGDESAAELWDEDEADEDEARGAAE